MELNARPYNNKVGLLFPAYLADFLPEGHLAYLIDEVVNSLDLSALYRKVSPVGNPSYHPLLMVKVLFYAYAVGLYSSRKIARALETDVAFMFLAGFERPDFRTISDFRKNNLAELRDIFKQIVAICYSLGMVELGNIVIDGTVIKANASVARTYDAERIEREIKGILVAATKIDEAEDKELGVEARGGELPEPLRKRKERLERLRAVMVKEGKGKINLTDPDANIQKLKGKKEPGYRFEALLDKKERVMVACDTTDEQADNKRLLPVLEQLEENLPLVVAAKGDGEIKLSGDCGVGGLDNLKALAARPKYNGFIPDSQFQAQERGKLTKEDEPFHRNKFSYVSSGDYFICPDGEVLLFKGERKDRGKECRVFQAADGVCRSCQYFGLCTKNKRGREIYLPKDEHLIEAMREKLRGAEGRAILKERKAIIELVFGDIKFNRKFIMFLLRGLRKVRGEGFLLGIVHNLLRIYHYLRRCDKGIKEMLAMRVAEIGEVVG